MSLSRIRKPTLIVLSLLLTLAVLSLAPLPAAPASGGNTIALKAPSFIKVANAQEEPAAALMGFPQDEAGISAYFKSASPVNLADVRGVYRVIEAETTDYIVGSVPVQNYSELYDVHVFVHRTGWLVAYYLSGEPTAKIADLMSYSGGSTIATVLEKTLVLVAGSAGVAFPGATYYDFRYPNATNLILVAESTDGGDYTFTIRLPSNFGYYERSWHARDTWQGGEVIIDGTVVTALCGGCMAYGTLSAAQLLPDATHTIAIEGLGAIAILYRVP